jgi:hypothetical protein
LGCCAAAAFGADGALARRIFFGLVVVFSAARLGLGVAAFSAGRGFGVATFSAARRGFAVLRAGAGSAVDCAAERFSGSTCGSTGCALRISG